MTVLVRKRSVSDLEFYKNAVDIRSYLTRLVLNEKYVPKKYRFIFTIPMINLFHELFKNITTANTIYAINEHELQLRRDYQTLAISNCEQILQLLQYMLDTLTTMDVNKLTPVIANIDRECALLKAWRKANRIISK